MHVAPEARTVHVAPEARTVRVICDVAGVRKAFDYTVPEALDALVEVGTSVRVVLHNRSVAGWVVEDGVEPPPGVSVLPLQAVRGIGPPPAVIDLARWAAWRWAGPPSRLLRTASSPTLVRSLPGVVAPPIVRHDSELTSVVGAELLSDLLSGGPAALRLAPAHDPYAVVAAAAEKVEAVPNGPGVLVLAPSHSSAQRLAERLRADGKAVAQLPDEWARARAGGCVAVGTRGAALAPIPRLAAAVVLDAHEEVYVEERAPTWWAWRVVRERARREQVPCVLVSACPTLDVLDECRLVTTSRSVERKGWSTVEVVDRRSEDPRSGLYSARLVELLRWAAAEPGRRMVCVLNRTGRARLSACATCGELARCERCGSATETRPASSPGAHGDGAPVDKVMHCRRCGAERPVVCTSCGSVRFKVLRVGVSRAREELEALANTPVAEVTGAEPDASDSVGRISSTADPRVLTADPRVLTADPRVLTADHRVLTADHRVVVGTEAVLHRVKRADVVAFLDFDAELLAPRLRAAEEALALVARAARMVGARPPSSTDDRVAAGAPDRAPGRVLLQTRQPQHDAVLSAVSADPSVLATSEMSVRSALGLPPVRAQALVSGEAADVYGAALANAALADAALAGVEVSGPVDGTWSLRSDDHKALCDLLERVERPAGRLRVEVDPVRA